MTAPTPCPKCNGYGWYIFGWAIAICECRAALSHQETVAAEKPMVSVPGQEDKLLGDDCAREAKRLPARRSEPALTDTYLRIAGAHADELIAARARIAELEAEADQRLYETNREAAYFRRELANRDRLIDQQHKALNQRDVLLFQMARALQVAERAERHRQTFGSGPRFYELYQPVESLRADALAAYREFLK